MRTEGFYLNGVGAVVPETMSVEHAVEQGWCTAERAKLHGMTGAAVAGDRSAPDMALQAARAAFAQSGFDPAGLGLMLYADTWHQGPDCWFPQHYLQHHLPTEDALSLEVRQGCNGMFCALELAYPFTRSSPSGTALLVGAENYGTPRIDRWASASFVFGDGASALLLSREGGFAEVLSVQSLFVPELEETHRFGKPVFPPDATTGGSIDLDERIDEFSRWGENRPEHALAWIRVHQKMLVLVNRVLSEARIGFSDISHAAFANLSPEDFEHRWMEMLGLSMDRSTWEYGRSIGHIGANDPVIGLHHLLSTGRVGPGDHVILGSVGSGVTLSCAVVRILDALPPEPVPGSGPETA